MPAKRHRNKTFRKVFVRVPSSKTVIQYRKRKPSKAICAGCGDKLKGVPRERPYKMQKMSKTEKRPERPYGGVLCSKCSRAKIISKVRGK
ncbi:MAG: 50S ribosomal protein L34e [Nanoarchaeota archaeon]|nr:50S ribosomal protein L34e [Nanoarchaeota archaeon]MBU4352448.1 50S ribosomal protein L34e [Nanoarchaeota archaeon]MBU4456957.1 50S ribosomal protein L34e [Nanoarchaeota archaeon]MCG2720039.1 50S ribosomal protein L34e [Nanoarchaeota archaeon]